VKAKKMKADTTVRSPPPPQTGDPSTEKHKATAARQLLREQKQRFDAAHKKGMKALEKSDFEALAEAIAEESAIIREQGAAAWKARKRR
jgi:hypothetical protein